MQTTINPAGQPIAVAGQGVDTGEGADDVSRTNGGATNIGFGLAVIQGTYDHTAVLPSQTTDIPQGVVLFDYSHSPGTFGDIDQAGTPPGLKQNVQFAIRRRGRIWVQLDAAFAGSIVAGVDRAYVRAIANGGNTLIGAFTNAPDAGKTIDWTDKGVFVSGVRYAADGTKIAELDVLAAAK
jgi:hypothetical protein